MTPEIILCFNQDLSVIKKFGPKFKPNFFYYIYSIFNFFEDRQINLFALSRNVH